MVLIFLSLTLTLEDAIDRMLKVSETSKILLYKMKTEQKINSYNYSNLLPSLEFNYSYSKIFPSKRESYSVNFSNSENLSLWNFLEGVETYFLNNESEFNYYNSLNEIIYNTITLYLNCYTARKMLDVRSKALERSNNYKSKIEEMFKLGLSSKADLLKAEVSNLQAQLEFIKAEKNMKEFFAQLRSLLDLKDEEIELVLPSLDFTLDSFDILKEKILRENYEIISIKNKIASLRLKLAENISQYIPSFYLKGSYGYSGAKFPETKEEWDANDSYSINFSLSMPLFSGFKRVNNTIVQKMQLDMEILNLKKKEKDLVIELENAFNSYIESKKLLEIAEKNVQVSNESMEATKLRFEMGEASVIELLSSEEDLLNAQFNLENALKDYILSIYKIKKLEGRMM